MNCEISRFNYICVSKYSYITEISFNSDWALCCHFQCGLTTYSM